ncbi:chitin binding Peritrophin-A domain protein, partial [Ancylostoma caninum]
MKCPSSLVFNEKMGYCDYPEICSSTSQGSSDGQSYVPPSESKPSKPSVSFVCPKPNGVFSLGCSVEFVVCSNDVAQMMTCPEGLVFNAAQGYCDHKENCSEGGPVRRIKNLLLVQWRARNGNIQGKPPVVTSTPASSEPPISTEECSHLPDGKFGSQCGPSFVVCSNGVAYTMSCPSDLVFDAKTNRCVYPDECGGKSESQSPPDATTPAYVPQTSRNDCVGKPDGLHSLGCIGEFLQCVDGRTYSLYCPAGLVFVEQAGACDVPSACKAAPPKQEDVSGPLPYEPI